MCGVRSLVVFGAFVCYLFVPSHCITNVKTETACESRTLSLVCDNDEVIKILYANYGRWSSMTCPHNNDKHRNCYARSTFNIVTDRCNGRPRCNLLASNVIFGEPCPGTAKYLFVQYQCYNVYEYDRMMDADRSQNSQHITQD